MYNVIKDLCFNEKAVLLDFQFITGSCKNASRYPQTYYALQLFSAYNNSNTSVLSIKSEYYNDFWRIMWHWKLE